jgi:hypothetical protein
MSEFAARGDQAPHDWDMCHTSTILRKTRRVGVHSTPALSIKAYVAFLLFIGEKLEQRILPGQPLLAALDLCADE